MSKEPQVAIASNLAPQMPPFGVMIPEKIVIDACLADMQKEFITDRKNGIKRPSPKRLRYELGKVFELSREALSGYQLFNNKNEVSITCRTLNIPKIKRRQLYHLLLRTRIHLYDNVVIDEYESEPAQTKR
ncbi:hypothetical protein JW935_11690 [candidate division KSB1 bacterium]|nr:hypothetical protein [candidate division KSB1 bacterium]